MHDGFTQWKLRSVLEILVSTICHHKVKTASAKFENCWIVNSLGRHVHVRVFSAGRDIP